MTKKDALLAIARIAEKSDWIDLAMDALFELIKVKEYEFARAFIDAFLYKLDTQDNVILTTANNKRLLAGIDKVYANLKSTIISQIVITMVKDINHIISENAVFYGGLSNMSNKEFKVSAGVIKEIVYSRLGLKIEGTLIKDGFMGGLLDMPEVRTKIKDFAYRSVLTQSGFTGFKKGLELMIEGEPEKLGAFSKYYRNMAYDTYSQVDAMQSKLFKEELGLKYFIYNGGIIKNSRKFCIDRAGEVFSTHEAQEWIDDPDNKAKPPNYDPLIHRGGYGCRHSIDYISDAMAFALRPDLKPATKPKSD